MRTPIYMDYHATTPVDPRVVEAMMPYFGEKFGNPASRNHSFGWEAEKAVDLARRQIAELIGANPREIVFTSGTTESNNLAIKGAAEMYASRGNHIITSAIEHKSVLDTCKRLEKQGFRVTYLPVGRDGQVSRERLEATITDKTILLSIIYANNEIGRSSRSRKSEGWRASTRFCFTRMRRRRWGKSRSTWSGTTSICCRFPGTRFMRRKASVRCTCGAGIRGWTWRPRWTAAAMSAGCDPAP